MSLKDRDKNQVNVTNGLETIKCVKTEGREREREETEEMIVAGHVGGKRKRWREGSMDSMMRFKLYFKRRTRPWRISSREHRVASVF